jgi:phosphocarrier protein FPr/phosphocarrier protein
VVQALVSERRSRQAAEARDAKELCFTADGVRIEVFANLASADDAHAAVAAGAEGCGLLRTEFLFLDRDTPPDKEEQQRVYSEIAAVLGTRPLIVRTLDIGADKNVPYVALGQEENPALGLRGIRLGFARPDLLVTQLAAIVAAVPAEQCRIMLPMVTEADEVRQVRRLLDGAAQVAGMTKPISLGAMVETPAAAVLADSIAAEADFLSIGTNDLTQYVLAADRGNAAVSVRTDALHPAVLRLIRKTTEGAREHGRWTGVCGGLASDTVAAPVLIGLGVTELSVAPAAVPMIKSTVRQLRIDDCRALAERACAATSAHEVRTMAAAALT